MLTPPASRPIVWQPQAHRVTRIEQFWAQARAVSGQALPTYRDLHAWSVKDSAAFWSLVWDFCGVVGRKGGHVLTAKQPMYESRFFEEARLNYAENVLRRADNQPAIVCYREDTDPVTLTFADLRTQVERLAAALDQAGVKAGDRVAGLVANTHETAIAALATASLGAVWCSCSPDFGVRGVLDRFAQIEPTVLFAIDGYRYQGRVYDNRDKIRAVAAELPSLRVTVHFASPAPLPEHEPYAEGHKTYDAFVAQAPARPLPFVAQAFSDPLFILFTSGTTGAPKCIVHTVGGTLLQHLKEHQLHCDFQPGDRVFYYSTCGWMMWNWLLSALASGTTIVLYDGSPTYPRSTSLFDVAEKEQLHFLGVSARYIDLLRKEHCSLIASYSLNALRMIGSTGSPLLPEDFDYVYAHIKRDVCLASLSGGTDIVSCFALGSPVLPVRRGELQTAGLGMNVAVFNDQGHAVLDEKGELVCLSPFPCMPRGFWNDPDHAKYRAAYFERFDGVWCHGDYVEKSSVSDGLVIYGRSDTVLKPGGVRIGTAEIYHALDDADDVHEALAVGQDWDGDMRVILFVVMKPGVALDAARVQALKAMIRAKASPRHVPSKIIPVSDIPRTRSGKMVEAAVRDVIHGRPTKNCEALANPEALEQFKHIAALSEA